MSTTDATVFQRVDLIVPFIEKDEAKRYGAKWDSDKHTWYARFMTEYLERWKPLDELEEDEEIPLAYAKELVAFWKDLMGRYYGDYATNPTVQEVRQLMSVVRHWRMERWLLECSLEEIVKHWKYWADEVADTRPLPNSPMRPSISFIWGNVDLMLSCLIGSRKRRPDYVNPEYIRTLPFNPDEA